MSSYATLFLAAFLAATFVPAWSEVLFGSLLVAGKSPAWLWFWASLGNTLGAVVNWGLGRWALHLQDRRWFPFKPERLERAQSWFRRYGVWSLLLAWMPVAGDGLTFIAGLMRVRFWLFFVLTFVGKATRYAFLLAVILGSLSVERIEHPHASLPRGHAMSTLAATGAALPRAPEDEHPTMRSAQPPRVDTRQALP